MFFNTYVTDQQTLEEATAIPTIQEVLLEPILLARQGTLTQPQLFELTQQAHQAKLKPVLVWDILMTETALQSVGDRLLSWDLDQFSAIRVSDIGVAMWLSENHPNCKLHLLVETGNHNLQGLLSWCDLFKDTLERLILSIELPEDKLTTYCHELPVDCELLGAGRILLFYSPRGLLSPALDAPQSALIETSIQTDEYGDRHFPTQESIHGTLMYLDKDQFLLDRLPDLQNCGFHTIRIDIRHFKPSTPLTLTQICQQMISQPIDLKESWPYSVRAPFFKANRTTATFPRLKSQLAPLKDTHCIAECIGSKNGEYGVFRTLHPFNRNQIKQLILPTKVAIDIPDYVTFHTIDGQELGCCDANKTIIMSWMKRTASGAIIVSHKS